MFRTMTARCSSAPHMFVSSCWTYFDLFSITGVWNILTVTLYFILPKHLRLISYSVTGLDNVSDDFVVLHKQNINKYIDKIGKHCQQK